MRRSKTRRGLSANFCFNQAVVTTIERHLVPAARWGVVLGAPCGARELCPTSKQTITNRRGDSGNIVKKYVLETTLCQSLLVVSAATKYLTPRGFVFIAECQFQEMHPIQKSRTVSLLLGGGILFFPMLFSWFTLRSGYSTVVRAVAFGWFSFVMLFIVATRDGPDLMQALIIPFSSVVNIFKNVVYQISQS